MTSVGRNSFGSATVNMLFLLIDNKIVYTLDDQFSAMKIPTDAIIDKIDLHISNTESSKKSNESSKFDDIGLIDY